MKGLDSASFKAKTEVNIPSDAQIIKKSVRMEVEEIENGFMLCKNYDIEYMTASGDTGYTYACKKWFSKKNPITVSMPKKDELADQLD